MDPDICEVRTLGLPSKAVPDGATRRVLCNEHLLHIVAAATLVAQGLADNAWLEVRVYGGDIDIVAETPRKFLAAIEVKPWIRRGGERYEDAVIEIKDKVYYYGKSGFKKMNLLYASFCGSGANIVRKACNDLGVNYLEMPGLWIEGDLVDVKPRWLPRTARSIANICGEGFLEFLASRRGLGRV